MYNSNIHHRRSIRLENYDYSGEGAYYITICGQVIPQMMQWFKTMTTNEYIQNVKQNHWQPFDKRLWQRNYFEHIIRNEKSLDNIREYIKNNPQNWEKDKNYFKNLFL